MNIIRFFLLAGLLLAIAPTQAQQLVVKPQAASGLYTLSYLGQQSGDLTVRILDANGTVLHREYLEDRQHLTRAYRLTQTMPGSYTFEVTGPDGKLQQSVAYPLGGALDVALVGSAADHRYQLQLDSPKGADVTVRIYDEDLNLLYEHRGAAAEHATKVYNLSQLPARSVTFSVSSDYEVVERRVNLR